MQKNSATRCVFCRMEETHHNDGKEAIYSMDHEAKSFVCSSCVQMFLQMPNFKLIQAFHLAKAKGYHDKAEWLENFITEEMEGLYGDETGKARRNLVRERPVPTARPGRDRFRT